MRLFWSRNWMDEARRIVFVVTTDDLLTMPRPTLAQQERWRRFTDEGLPISERLAIAAEFARHVEGSQEPPPPLKPAEPTYLVP